MAITRAFLNSQRYDEAKGNMHWEALQEWVADGNSITAAD